MGVKFKFTVEDYDAISFILGKMIKKNKVTRYNSICRDINIMDLACLFLFI